MKQPSTAAIVKEERRLRAMALLDSGLTITQVGVALGHPTSTIMRWRNIRAEKGVEGLAVHFSPGRPRRMTDTQRERIGRLLLKGAEAHGHDEEGWTTARIAELIERECGIEYHRCHMGRLMESLGWKHSDDRGWHQIPARK